jgi:hypothetical protein
MNNYHPLAAKLLVEKGADIMAVATVRVRLQLRP